MLYVWLNGQMSAVVPEATVTPNDAMVQIKPVKPAEDAATGVSIQSFTTPVTPGSNASITIKTNSDATCSITVVYDEEASVDSGLSPKIADEFGIAMWVWTVEASVPVGEWPVTITCVRNGQSGVVVGDLEVIYPTN
jgi:hypothetical protein